jgi:hypothetical protein
MAMEKGGLLKGLLGCGCLLLLIGLVGSALLGWGVYEASKELKSIAQKTLDGEDLQKFKREFQIPEVASTQVKKAVERPLQEADLDRFLALNDWYYDKPANEKAAKLMELDLSDPAGILELMSDADAQTQVKELLKSFPKQVEAQGGWSTSVDSSIRATSMAALADAVGTATGKPSDSSEIANLMLQNADKLQDDKWLANLGVTSEKTGALKPLLDVVKLTPKASFEAWKAVPEAKRTRAVEAWRRQGRAALGAQFNPILKTCRAFGACD